MRAKIKLICQKFKAEFNGSEDILMQDKWAILKGSEEFLQLFYEATLKG